MQDDEIEADKLPAWFVAWNQSEKLVNKRTNKQS